MSQRELSLYRRKHLGYVFQSYNLIPNLTVKENIEVGAYLADKPLPTEDILKTLGLWEHRDKVPSQLSGGQQQRTAIGRAIIKNPDILLCDEPTGALDSRTGREVLDFMRELNAEGNTIVLITHDEGLARKAQRIVRITDGKIDDGEREVF